MDCDLQKYIIHTEDTILDALKGMNRTATGTVFVCDMQNRFYGTVTDGDVRRYLVSGGNVDVNIMTIVNRDPYVIHDVIDKSIDYQKIMQEKIIKAIPVVDSREMLIGVVSIMDNFRKKDPIDVPVVIMAGGMGTRLQPYTDILPKPLIPIGNKTITERILDSFLQNGSNRFYMIVNYKKEFIKTYFHDKRTQYVIQFIDEEKYCGTGGGLALLRGKIKETFIMTNCDILLEDSYKHYVTRHKESGNIITVVGAKKTVQLPYGVVNVDGTGTITSIEEKPQYTFLTNTGFYIIEPELIELISPDCCIHMTELIEKCISYGYKVGTCQIDEEKWFDMGQLDELEKMKRKFE